MILKGLSSVHSFPLAAKDCLNGHGPSQMSVLREIKSAGVQYPEGFFFPA